MVGGGRWKASRLRRGARCDRYSVVIDRNTEIALSVRRNYSIRASILLYRRGERRLAGRSFGEEGYVDPACIRIARGE